MARKRLGPTVVQRTRLQLPLLPSPPSDEEDLEPLQVKDKAARLRGRRGGLGDTPARPRKLTPTEVNFRS